jgi:L-rhamnose mutarotase
MTKSFAMTLNLKDRASVIDRYKKYHLAVWPDVIEGLRSIGISKMNIFLVGRRLFMYFEAPDDFDIGSDFPRYMASGRAKEWDDLMRTFQEPVPEAAKGAWWAEMGEVFDLDWEPEDTKG